VIFVSWPTASLAIAYAFAFAPQDKTSIVNAIAATYPALVSAVVLWYCFGEAMSLQKVVGLIVIVVGVITVLLA
jgi:uncharacterized membrane protein